MRRGCGSRRGQRDVRRGEDVVDDRAGEERRHQQRGLGDVEGELSERLEDAGEALAKHVAGEGLGVRRRQEPRHELALAPAAVERERDGALRELERILRALQLLDHPEELVGVLRVEVLPAGGEGVSGEPAKDKKTGDETYCSAGSIRRLYSDSVITGPITRVPSARYESRGGVFPKNAAPSS